MADTFRRMLDCKTSIGGVHCYCCNSYRGKDKAVLRRIVRRAIKQKYNQSLELTEKEQGTSNSDLCLECGELNGKHLPGCKMPKID